MKYFAFSAWALFYGAYYTKKLIQQRSGIRTNQMAIGNKTKKTLRTETAISIVSVLMAIIAPFSIFLNFHHMSIHLQAVGVSAAFLGDIMLILSMTTMKSSWRAGIPTEDKTQLVTRGIYQISRNPAFLGFDLLYIGLALAFPNAVQTILCITAVVIFHLQIQQEEAFLNATFSKEYLDYSNRVRRYLGRR